MSRPQVKIYDCITNEEIIRDATDEEIIQIELDAAKAQKEQAEAESRDAARQALLDKLGITAEEAKLLLS
jgi:uncharacterized protein (UPF0371 family)